MKAQPTLKGHYSHLNVWEKLGVWASITSIIGFIGWLVTLAIPAKSTPQNASSVSGSTQTTVIQSGRDVVINPTPSAAPPPNPARTPPDTPRVAQNSKSAVASSQTMINSPGGIQAGGNVTITSDRRVINAITLRISVDTETPVTTPTEVGTDAGLQSIVGLFTKDKTRIRFATDFLLRDQQVSETHRRISFTYTPETPEEILGKPLDFLSSIDVLAVNYAEIFGIKKFDTSRSKSQLQCVVSVNGVAVATINTDIPPGTLKGQANFSVAQAFTSIPAAYESAVAKR